MLLLLLLYSSTNPDGSSALRAHSLILGCCSLDEPAVRLAFVHSLASLDATQLDVDAFVDAVIHLGHSLDARFGPPDEKAQRALVGRRLVARCGWRGTGVLAANTAPSGAQASCVSRLKPPSGCKLK